MALRQRQFGLIFASQGAAGLSPAFPRREQRISCLWSVVSCQGNLRFANGTKTTAL